MAGGWNVHCRKWMSAAAVFEWVVLVSLSSLSSSSWRAPIWVALGRGRGRMNFGCCRAVR